MVQSSSKSNTDEGGEIDRIIQEIESMEKDMDKVVVPMETKATAPHGSASVGAAEAPDPDQQTSRVVPLRSTESVMAASAPMESMVESDAVMASNEPLAFERNAVSTGGLSLKVGGCSTVSLEFEYNGMTVSLRCEDETLTISTDAGAEFRVPLRTKEAA